AIGEAMRRERARAQDRGELLRVTLASIGDGVIAADNSGQVTYLNAIAELLTGWSTAEALGEPLERVFQLAHEADNRPFELSGAFTPSGERVVRAGHAVLLSKDGSVRPVDHGIAPIRDEAGAISGRVAVFRDISVRRRTEQAETQRMLTARELAAIVETSDDAIISKSLEGVLRSWNSGAERLFGYSASEVLGKHVSLVIPPERIDEEEKIITTLRAGQRVDHFETERLRKDGTRIAVSLTVSPILDDRGTVVGASKIVRDISERRRLELGLRKLAADLEAADRRKNEFLATLSHELRNPLAPMRTTLQLLKRGASDPASLPGALELLDRQLDQLVRLVDDLLDLSRITHNRIELRRSEVELEPLLRSAVESVQPPAAQAAHEIRFVTPDRPVFLFADAVRLRQVFGNLIHNSYKYSPAGGVISIALERREEEAVVTIRDNGVGIPADQLESIFEMFTQVHSSRGLSQGGLGIGLTLVQRLIAMHGGSIVARSSGEGRGSEFEVRLPALPGPLAAPEAIEAEKVPAATAARPAVGQGAGGLHATGGILVVDDNQDAASSLAILLKMSGYQVRTAFDGVAALELVRSERPAVVLLDLGMPHLSGHEVCRRIRAEPWGRDIRIFALTGWGQEADRLRTAEAGFDGHLVKPIDIDKLLEILGRLRA
ncbi:MAG: PAS domain S-box protein, partial [Thermoanaerobaculia bacterium]